MPRSLPTNLSLAVRSFAFRARCSLSVLSQSFFYVQYTYHAAINVFFHFCQHPRSDKNSILQRMALKYDEEKEEYENRIYEQNNVVSIISMMNL